MDYMFRSFKLLFFAQSECDTINRDAKAHYNLGIGYNTLPFLAQVRYLIFCYSD